MTWSYNPEGIPSVWAPSAFARHYLRNRFLFLFLRLLRCFTSAGFAFHTLCIRYERSSIASIRLPHSDIPGSSLACSFPRLFAACRVLLRLLAPRHSPYALTYFIILQSCYHFHNTTKPFRDLLYCLIAWYACLSCVL